MDLQIISYNTMKSGAIQYLNKAWYQSILRWKHRFYGLACWSTEDISKHDMKPKSFFKKRWQIQIYIFKILMWQNKLNKTKYLVFVSLWGDGHPYAFWRGSYNGVNFRMWFCQLCQDFLCLFLWSSNSS